MSWTLGVLMNQEAKQSCGSAAVCSIVGGCRHEEWRGRGEHIKQAQSSCAQILVSNTKRNQWSLKKWLILEKWQEIDKMSLETLKCLAWSQWLPWEVRWSQSHGSHPLPGTRFQCPSVQRSQARPVTLGRQGHVPVLGSQMQGPWPGGHSVVFTPEG